jgi:protein-tyrosine phosphatase
MVIHKKIIVLTAAAMLGVSYPKEMGIAHKIIKAFDLPTYKMTPHFEVGYQFIREGLQNGNVLVHCAAGISRVKIFS